VNEPLLRSPKLIKRHHFSVNSLLPLACLALGTLGFVPAHAVPASHHAAASRPGAVADFRALAQQRPRECPPVAGTAAGGEWPDGKAACAWQNRLREQSWRWRDGGTSPCISRQARWWSWAQAALPPAAQRSVWDARWTGQALRMTLGDEERMLTLQRDGANQWQATEWRWNPHPRPATRRWQQGRWKSLVESAARQQQGSVGADAAGADATRMQAVFRRVLGARPGELGPDGLALEAAGLCLRASNPLPGQAKLSLSYSPNDSRLEQRAAMHLQLSRQHPDAKWLTQFKMLDMPAKLPSGAKFLASWVEAGQLNSQLWMPAKGDAPMVRVRMSTRLPRGQDEAAPATSKAKQIVEHELETIAVQWAAAYE